MRGDAAGAASGCPFDTPSAPRWRGISSPPGLWDCGNNLYQTLSRASMIRVTWATYHDCDHICITPMVDLLLIRCKDAFVSDVWVDVYVTLFLRAFSDKTSVLGLARGMCALVRVIWQQVWGNEKNRWAAMVLPLYNCLTKKNGFTLHKTSGNHTLLERMHSIFNIMS
jgi:hypothetical protein